MSAKTEYIIKLASRIPDLAADLEILEAGGKIAGLFDEFGAPPVDVESTKGEIKRMLTLIDQSL